MYAPTKCNASKFVFLTIYSTCCDIFGKGNGDSKIDEAVVILNTIKVVSVVVCESLSFCVKIKIEDQYEPISTKI